MIDPSTNIMYVVACTLEGGTMAYRLHAIDITNGTEPYPNVLISGSYGGSTFDARYQTQRVSLALSGNQVVFGFGAIELEYAGGYVGWVMAYNKTTLQQSGVFATVTTGSRGGGVWQSGRPPVVDSAGYVYVFTGNAYGNGYDGVHNFSESVLKLDPANGLALKDWFTAGNWSTLDSQDADLTSSGPLLIPGTSLIAGGGKTGDMYVLNTANLGKFNASDSQVVQKLHIAADEIRGGPVFWQRSTANGGPLLYNSTGYDWVKSYAFTGTAFGSAAVSSSGGNQSIWPGGILTLSANGEQHGSGVLWATMVTSGNAENHPPTPGALHAYDAENLSNELWNSTNGKVYVATWSNQVAVYGLSTANPTFSPAPATYVGTQSVTLSDTTANAVIYYTTNGTTPTTSSAPYVAGTPLSISATTTVQAIAVASGRPNSAVASGTYTILAQGTTPVSVSLAAVDNVPGFVSTGTAVTGGGIDGGGYAYAANLLGTSLTWSGSTFTFSGVGAADAVSSATVALPVGNFSSIGLLATGVNGNQTNQSFVVTYTDGTTTTITQSLSDWHTPQNYAGETQVLTMAYRIGATGATENRTFYLYGYSFAINGAKTVKSITLPKNRNVVVLAIDAVP